jgi:hypothetical protein
VSTALRKGLRALIRAAGSSDNPPSGQRLLYPGTAGWIDRASDGTENRIVDAALAKSQAGLPSYVPATVLGPYNPMFCTYNALPSLLRKTEAAFANAATSRRHVLVMGDSMGLGYNGVSVVDANSYPKQLSTAIASALGIAPGGSGMTPVVSAGGVLNNLWTTTGTVNTSLYPAMLTMSSGSTATFAPPEAGTAVAFTYSDLSAAFTYSVDGGTAVAVTPGGTSTTKRVAVTGLASGPHTIRITQTAASGNVFLYTGEVYATTGVSVHNLSYGGSRAGAGGPSASWTDTSSGTGTSIYGARKQSFDAAAYTPDLVVVCLGPNDILAGDSNATALGGLLTMKGWYPTADFVLLNTWEQPASPAGTWDSYRAAKYAWCDTNGAVYVDLSAKFGPVTTAQANGLVNTTDNVHPTDGANREIGRLLAAPLLLGGGALSQAAADGRYARNTYGAQEKNAPVTGTAGTVVADLSQASFFTLTPTAAVTLSLVNLPQARDTLTVSVLITQGATAYAVTMPSGTVWLQAVPTQVANKACLITMTTSNGGATWYATAAVQP